jgi:hypothetical protein
VAIVQVSRITQRKGLQTDLPQPLASAELGWAVDERRLFIGNGTTAEGAPVVGNTEILTEFSDVLSFLTQYTYKGEAAGYEVQTGATLGAPITQSLQRRLDSYAVITDFGATGDGVTDVTADINRALFQIYCRSENASARRSLFFPAGEYIITGTLNIPPNATLYGEGIDSTVINFQVLDWTSAVSWPAGVLVFNTTTGLYYRSNFAVPIGVSITASTTGGDPYWTTEALPSYIVRTADSLQQTGVNIGVNGAEPPGGVRVSGIKFKVNRVTNGVLVEKAKNCSFESVSIEGALELADLIGTADNTAAVRWDSTPGDENQTSQNVTWNNCEFLGFTYATESNQNIRGITFSNCDFYRLYRGIVLGGVAPEYGGPTGVRIVQNTFDQINREGIIVSNVSLNATAYNTFYDVGNQFIGVANPSSPIIVIDADNNISVGDSFQRNNIQSANNPRIALGNSSSIAMGMNVKDVAYFQNNVQTNTIANSIDLGTYKQLAGIQDSIVSNSSGNLAVITNGINRINAFKIDYTIERLIGIDRVYRSGTLSVISGTGFSYSDEFVENATTGVTLVAAYNAGPPETVTISYSATNTGQPATINYSISTLG